MIPPKDFSVLVLLDANSKKIISLRGYEDIRIGQVTIASVLSATDYEKVAYATYNYLHLRIVLILSIILSITFEQMFMLHRFAALSCTVAILTACPGFCISIIKSTVIICKHVILILFCTYNKHELI